MMQTVPQGEAERVIELLAQKLSVPAEHLWEVLTRQAYANVVIAVGKFAIIAGVSWALYLVYKRAMAWAAEEYKESNSDAPFVIGIVSSIIAIVLSIFLLITSLNVVEAAGLALNPEYFALKTILNAVK